VDSEHLDEQGILDWLEGALPRARLGAMLAHVDRCDPCRELTAAVMHATVAPSSEGPTPTAAPAGGPVQAGTLLGERFELLEPVGAGAMGIVWRARDRTIDQDVALKLLPADRAQDAGYLARFRDELLLARAISHPNVCRLHDLVEADGRWFLTMELIEGAPLSVVTQGGLDDVTRAQALLRQIAAGVAAAHAAGVVHRDLKPSNIMVTREDRAVVLDFGIARRDGDGGRTEAGVLVGTPRYMAPEQSKTSKVDARADVYALGLIGCELLTGTVPLDRGDLVPTLVARGQEDPPSVRRLAPQAPPRLAKILDACLRRDPEARPADGAAVLALLEGRAELATQSRPWPLVVVAVAVLGLTVAAWALWPDEVLPPPPPIALGAFEAADPADAWLTKALPALVAEELQDGWGLDLRQAPSEPPAQDPLVAQVRRSGVGIEVAAVVHYGSRAAELSGSTPRELGLAVAGWLADEHPRASLRPTPADLKSTGCALPLTWRRLQRTRRAHALEEGERAAALAKVGACGVDPLEPESDPSGDGLARVEHAEVLLATGDVDRSIAKLEALAREGPERGLALRALAGLEAGYIDGWLSRAPAPERGLRHAEEAVQSAPHDVGALAVRALAKALVADHDGAEQDAAVALRWAERPPDAAILALVTSAAMQANWDDAAAAGRRLLETDRADRDAEALALLGGIDLARGAFERGHARITEAAQRYETRGEPGMAAETWLLLSWGHELLGEHAAAVSALDRAAAADPTYGERGGEVELARRMVELQAAADRGEAREPLLGWYRERVVGIPLDPPDVAAMRHLELYAAWQDRNLEEVSAIHREITLGTYVETWISFPAAEAAEQAGDLVAAETHYRALVDDPYSWEEPILEARARLGLGRVLAALGRQQEAGAELERFVAAWDQAPTDAPELKEARRLLTALPRP
jgi:eukaryotic-like serine/threonine-protein kinase